MTNPLAEQVAGLKPGDWVEARFEDGQASAVYTDVLVGDGQSPLFLEIGEKIIRYRNGDPAEGLVSITRVPHPIPSEPEVGSFALTKKRHLFVNEGDGKDPWICFNNRCGHSWPEIFPHITRLYTPSGDEVTGFEYAGGDK